MTLSINSPKETTYVRVNISDPQNGNTKTYLFQEGTILNTTNTSYYLSKDGIKVSTMTRNQYYQPVYGTRQAYEGNTINVTLPQYIALDVLDVNQDQKFDDYDVTHAETFTQTDDGGVDVEESTADFEINDRLERAKSNYRACDGWGSGVDFDRENRSFDINFIDLRENNRYEFPNSKSLSIFLPHK